MVQEVLLNLSIIIIVSAVLAVIARIIKQPPIIAYLIAGVVVGPLFLNITASSSEFIQVFAHIGVAFLLFIVGLSLDLRVLKEIGVVSTFAGIAEIIVVGGIGFLISAGLGMGSTTALYIGAALAFSSTVVVVKILSDKKEIDTLHGRIALGILIVEDFVAALALMIIPLSTNSSNILVIASKFGIALLTIFIVFFIAFKWFDKLLDYLARSQEVLFLFGIGWALSLATLFDALGFSLEIGALVAGMSLASSKYTLELGGKIKPLRDFFVVLFFVFFWSQMVGPITKTLILQSVFISAIVLIIKPLIVMLTLRLFGYGKRTNFLTGLSLSQISEFSLILTLLGFTTGHITQEIMSLAVLIALITIGISSYGIYYSQAIFNRVTNALFFIEGKKQMDRTPEKKYYDIIVFGYHRIGYKILESIKNMKMKVLVIDYNPRTINALEKSKIDAIYGDASDKEFLSQIGLGRAKMVISTIPEQGANIAIAEVIKMSNSSATFIATAEQPPIALVLYESGVDYVLIPHHLGGYYAAGMIEKFKTDQHKYKELGKKHRIHLSRGKANSNY